MKRHKAIQQLSRDHHKGLLLAQLMKKDAPHYNGLPTDPSGKLQYAIETFNNELFIHFSDEENILFSAVKGKSAESDNLIDELIEEHKYFNEKISLLNGWITTMDNDSDLIEKLDEFGKKLERHIRKEERVLFNLIQEILSEDELSKIEQKILDSRKNFTAGCNIKTK